MPLAEVLEPAAKLAEEGFPVNQMCSSGWQVCFENNEFCIKNDGFCTKDDGFRQATATKLLEAGPYGKELLVPDGEGGFRGPNAGARLPSAGLLRVSSSSVKVGPF